MVSHNEVKQVKKQTIDLQDVNAFLKEHGISLIKNSQSPQNVQVNFLGLSRDYQELIKTYIAKIFSTNFKNKINTFVPGRNYPSMSVTGNYCEQNCEHCNRKYLDIMKDISSEKKLCDALDKLIEKGAKGCLISGGSTKEGKVPILKYKDTLKKYAETGKLIFNYHTGLFSPDEVKELKELKPNVVSFDFTLDENIIKNIYHLNDRTPEDYKKTLDAMVENDINVVPHICLGLNFGTINKELEALEYLSKYNFPLIVFIVLIPPPNPPNSEKFVLTEPDKILDIFIKSRLMFPKSEISLGCMRPRGKKHQNIEDFAIMAGFNRIVIPSKSTLYQIEQKKFTVKTYASCCAIPLD